MRIKVTITGKENEDISTMGRQIASFLGVSEYKESVSKAGNKIVIEKLW